MAKNEVKIRITGDTSKLRSSLDEASGKLGGFGGKIKSGLGGVAGVVGGAFAVGAVAGFGVEMFGLGQKLDVFARKSDTVFEGSSAAVKKWADKNNEAFGLSDEELTGLAANFGDLMKPMGFTADQAAGMSKEVIGLSGALSAWSGGTRSAAEVSETLAKAMLGEREELKGLGISITEADVKARLAKKGQEDLTGAALQQAEALATQELIFEKSTDAQKAWADGSMDGIKTTNELKAKFGDLKSMIADKVLPVGVKLAEWAVDTMIPGIERLGGKAQELWQRWVPTFVDIGAAVRSAFTTAQEWIDKARGAFGSLGQEASDKTTWLGETVGKARLMFENLSGAVTAVIARVVDVVRWGWGTFGETIMTALQRAFDAIRNIFSGVIAFLTGVFGLIENVLTGNWSGAWDSIKQILSGAWQVIRGVIQLGFTQIRAIFSGGLDLLGKAWSFVWGAIKSVAGDAWDWVKRKAGDAVEWFKSVPGKIGGALSGMWDGMKDGFRSAINWVIDHWNGISFTLPSINIPGFGEFGGGTFSTPNIPRLADGGIVRARPGGTLALIGEGGRDEAVVPLDRRGGFGGSNITINVTAGVGDPVEIGRKVADALRAYERHGGTAAA